MSEPDSGDSAFAELHTRIGACRCCADLFDTTKAPRRLDATPRTARLFLVAQALAETTQRLSGVPFVTPLGELSSTGRRLEALLGAIGFSLRPGTTVELEGGRLPAHGPGLRQAYNSDLIQCFPGKRTGAKGDAVPRKAVRTCLGQGYLLAEIELVDPAVILLLGNQAYRHFLRELLPPAAVRRTVTAVLDDIAGGAPLPRAVIAGKDRVVVPIIHPSGLAAGRFERYVLSNGRLIRELRILLRT
jgi:uracil-DNA glycosylase